MEKSLAITTIATIASLCENNSKKSADYLDIITPFICQCLPASIGSKVDVLNIKQSMQTDFGFMDMPVGVIQKIILRLSEEAESIVQREGDQSEFSFIMKTSNPKDGFKSKSKKSKADMEHVAKELMQFLKNEYDKVCDIEEAKKLLLESFSMFFASILDSERGIIPSSVSKSDIRRVAKFILSEKRKSTSVFDKIEDLTKGYIIYQAIYYYEKQPNFVSTVNLNNVTIYLDTPVLIDALGYRNAEGTKAVNDLIQLIKTLGGTVKVFAHILDELKGILEAFCEKYPDVNTFKLDSLLRKYKSRIAILSLSQSLEKVIGSEFEIVEAPYLGITKDWEMLNVEESIQRFYAESVKKLPAKEMTIGSKRIEYDIRSLMGVMRDRSGKTPTSFDACDAILLSDSKTARKVYSSIRDGIDDKEINFVYGVMDLSCLFWLSSARCSTNIREDALLYSVAAAIEPSEQIIQKMLKYTRELESAGTVLPETAIAMRSNPRAKQLLADISGNDIQAVSRKSVIRVANEVLLEERASTKALPKMRKWKSFIYYLVNIFAWIFFAVLFGAPVVLQFTQAGNNQWLIIISIIVAVVALMSLLEKNQTIKHVGTVLGNYVEDLILANEVKKAREHAEYFLK